MQTLRPHGRFERHPRITLLFLLVAVFALLDLAFGYFFCPRIVGDPDAIYHHDLPHNFNGTKVHGDMEHRFVTNSLGFKDRENRVVARESERHRILLLGDSFVEGVGYPYEETFAGILDDRLRSEDVELLNAGVGSYSPKLYYLKMKYLLETVGLKVDQLVVFVDLSDIQDEVIYENFTPDDGFGLSRLYLFNRADSLLKQHSLTYWFVRNKVLHLNTTGFERLPGNNPFEDKPQEFLEDWWMERGQWTANDDLFEAWGRRGVELAMGNMERLYRLCNEFGVAVTVVVYPWPDQIFNREIDSKQVAIWQKFCEDRELKLINLFPDFIDGGDPEAVVGRYFIDGDFHWNRQGHRFVADLLWQEIRRRN